MDANLEEFMKKIKDHNNDLDAELDAMMDDDEDLKKLKHEQKNKKNDKLNNSDCKF
jgi:hypothetical protein